ncbi:SpoIIE family protein phosphatase [Aliamphritea spongicola]|nr:SpoIIE family protein phosphatase [Aliamphritea spongicola]
MANAGQPRPVLCRANTESDDAVRQLDIDGPLPGLSLQQGAETAYPEYCLQLGDGERLLIYSDGVLDAAETPSETFISRIHDSMGMPLPQAADYLMQQLPADPQADDITLILLGRL